MITRIQNNQTNVNTAEALSFRRFTGRSRRCEAKKSLISQAENNQTNVNTAELNFGMKIKGSLIERAFKAAKSGHLGHEGIDLIEKAKKLPGTERLVLGVKFDSYATHLIVQNTFKKGVDTVVNYGTSLSKAIFSEPWKDSVLPTLLKRRDFVKNLKNSVKKFVHDKNHPAIKSFEKIQCDRSKPPIERLKALFPNFDPKIGQTITESAK